MANVSLPYRFKSGCQKKAIQLRVDMGLKPSDAMDAFHLANFLGVDCIPHSKVCNGESRFNCLNCSNWSAIFVSDGEYHMILYNDTHADTRNQSSIMHEISHFILGHATPPFLDDYPLFHRDHEPQQELEANTLSSILLLPRIALENCAKKSMKINGIVEEYGVSKSLAIKELNMSGILKQYKRWNPFLE